jgi:hypothetical protein
MGVKTGQKQGKERYSHVIVIAVILLAAAAAAVGIARGEAVDIFLKGTNICLACIGIG